ncbi:MAG: GNAT family N-acetyltransferase [Planctomycetota bacterium]|nr:GNAT family N-acetyltransferase [Planctomycetota bacterium]
MNVRKITASDESALLRFLHSRPDTTMFLQGNLAAAGLVDEGERFQGTYAAAFEGDEVVAVAALYWNRNLVIEAPRHLEDVVRETLRAAPRPLQGLTGIHAQVVEARRLLGLEDAPTTMDSKEILYRLLLSDLRVPEALAAGRVTCRRATPDDLPVLVPWGRAYRSEAIGLPDDPSAESEVETSMRSGIAGRRLWILHAGEEPVAMTGFNTQTPACVQVGGVYTPPELRSNGYARAAVAGSLRDARAEGAERSILFTGEDNPAAQACYVKLGYEPVGDYHLLRLEEPM